MSTATDQLKTAVTGAVEDLRLQFGRDVVETHPDGQGGAWVRLLEVPLSDRYEQDTSFVIFQLAFTLPAADVYPLFLRGDLSRSDGAGLGAGFALTALQWQGSPPRLNVVQVSRRTRGSRFEAQSVVLKVEKVLDWVRYQ